MEKTLFSCSRNQVEFIDRCPECGSKRLHFADKRAELICLACGFVIADQVPVIEAMHNTKAVRVLVNPAKGKMAVVLQGILRTNAERAMLPFYAEIKKMDLKKQVEAGVIRICQNCVDKKITKKATKLEILCAATYIVSKKQGIPIFFDDFETTYGIDKVKAMRAYRKICRELKIPMKPVSNVNEYIIRICTDMGADGELATVAIEAAKMKVTDNPVILAAASIYIAAAVLKIQLKQREVAKYARISEPALRENFEKLIDRVDLVKLKEYADKINE